MDFFLLVALSICPARGLLGDVLREHTFNIAPVKLDNKLFSSLSWNILMILLYCKHVATVCYFCCFGKIQTKTDHYDVYPKLRYGR